MQINDLTVGGRGSHLSHSKATILQIDNEKHSLTVETDKDDDLFNGETVILDCSKYKWYIHVDEYQIGEQINFYFLNDSNTKDKINVSDIKKIEEPS